jgi:hypothetical protein
MCVTGYRFHMVTVTLHSIEKLSPCKFQGPRFSATFTPEAHMTATLISSKTSK